MAKIIKAEIIDGILHTDYDDGYFTDIVIPKGYSLSVRLIKSSYNKREIVHYRYAVCNVRDKATTPNEIYSVNGVTCKICLASIEKLNGIINP